MSQQNPFAAYPLYMKVGDIMDALQISKTAAYELMRNPNCPTVIVGQKKGWRVNRDKFFAWLLTLEGGHTA